MRRRTFIALLGGASAASAWPLGAWTQQSTMPIIGFLGADSNDIRSTRLAIFHKGLTEAGYVEGRNVAVEYRWADGHLDRYQELAAELVRRQVTVIATMGGIPAALAAKTATTSIPVVVQGSFDLVELKLVASLGRPGGNVTGVTTFSLELGPKRLEMMHELLPATKVFALLINPDHPNAEPQSQGMQEAARSLGLQIRIVHARTVGEFDAAFASVARVGADGLLIGSGQPFTSRPDQLGEIAARYKVPAIFESRQFAAAGGLVSYTGSQEEAYHLVGLYVGRILKGEKPADLPVQRSTKVELTINLKIAKTLGLTVPQSLLARADEVIE